MTLQGKHTQKKGFDKHIGGVGVDIQAFYDSSQDDAASRNKTEGENELSDSQTA